MRNAILVGLVTVTGLGGSARAAVDLSVTNPGFEDTTGLFAVQEFNLGVPQGWSVFGSAPVLSDGGTFTGTLQPNGTDFFNTTAPEGTRVAILFNAGQQGAGAYGYAQTLGDTLQSNTQYTLTVEVGNIASGTSQDNTFYNLDEFPGYRVELLAGGVVIASDDNSLTIPEAQFATATVSFTTGDSHAQLDQALGIRLINLNLLPDGYTLETSPDLEVDFDDVRLTAEVIPEPSGLAVLGVLGWLAGTNRRRNGMRRSNSGASLR